MIELILSKLKITEAQHAVKHWCWEDKLYGNSILKFNGRTIYSNCFEERRKCIRKWIIILVIVLTVMDRMRDILMDSEHIQKLVAAAFFFSLAYFACITQFGCISWSIDQSNGTDSKRVMRLQQKTECFHSGIPKTFTDDHWMLLLPQWSTKLLLKKNNRLSFERTQKQNVYVCFSFV